MSTETSGANRLPDLPGLPRRTRTQPHIGPDWEPATSTRLVQFRARRWRTLPEEIAARKSRRSEAADRARHIREVDHLAGHPNIPANLIEALQYGSSTAAPSDPLSGTIVTIDGCDVHVAVSSKGTGIPEPDSQGVWDGLRHTVREINDRPYCADVVVPLPQEIAAIGWANAHGQSVNVTPCKAPPRLRAVLGIVFLPLARLGDIATMSATSSVAALVLGTGSLTPASAPAEPTPDLQPKTGISQRQHQAAPSTLRGPKKARVRVRPPGSGQAATSTPTSLPLLASDLVAAGVSQPAASALAARPAPKEQPDALPESTHGQPAEAGPQTLVAGLPSLWGNPN